MPLHGRVSTRPLAWLALILSLAAFGLAAALWVRGYFAHDWLVWNRNVISHLGPPPFHTTDRNVHLHFLRGSTTALYEADVYCQGPHTEPDGRTVRVGWRFRYRGAGPRSSRFTRPFHAHTALRPDLNYPSRIPPSRMAILTFPTWLPALIALLDVWLSARRTFGKGRSAGDGRCAQCGYDLRATPHRCPECGSEAASTGPTRGDLPTSV